MVSGPLGLLDDRDLELLQVLFPSQLGELYSGAQAGGTGADYQHVELLGILRGRGLRDDLWGQRGSEP